MADHADIDHTGLTGVGNAEITAIPTTEMDDSLVLAPDGAGGVEFREESGGGAASFDTYLSALSGLVHRWEFTEASGNFADSVGSLTLTPSGTWTYSVSGAPVGGAVTAGASAKADTSGLGSIPVGGAARSFVCVYKAAISTSKQTLWSYGAAGSATWWTQFINDGQTDTWSVTIFGGDLNLGYSASSYNRPPTSDGRWHLGISIYNGDQETIAQHDLMSGCLRIGSVLNTTSGGNFRIGQDTGAGNQFEGSIDDLAVFDRALTAAEIIGLVTRLGT